MFSVEFQEIIILLSFTLFKDHEHATFDDILGECVTSSQKDFASPNVEMMRVE